MRRVQVWANTGGENHLVGELIFRQRLGGDATSFTYDTDFAYGDAGFDVAPNMRREDIFFNGRGLPLFIQDAGPDSWGAHLVRRAATEQREYAEAPDALGIILAASDLARQGALRFTEDQDGAFLTSVGVPAHIELEDLLAAADEVANDTDSFEPYARLLGTGTSALGGARPKASLVDEGGRLLVAKFPWRQDKHNVPAWEKVTLDLAQRAGIEVPESELVRIGSRDVLLLVRFDRDNGDSRVPYMSYRTLMGNPDDGSLPPDYRDIARALRTSTDTDLSDLYRRTAFSVLVNNTDDHLRNMGALHRDGQWLPAPMFDVNPDFDYGNARHTGVAGRRSLPVIRDGLSDLATHCGMTERQAHTVLGEIHDAIRGWRDLAQGYGIAEREQDRMAALLAHTAEAAGPVSRCFNSDGGAGGQRLRSP